MRDPHAPVRVLPPQGVLLVCQDPAGRIAARGPRPRNRRTSWCSATRPPGESSRCTAGVCRRGLHGRTAFRRARGRRRSLPPAGPIRPPSASDACCVRRPGIRRNSSVIKPMRDTVCCASKTGSPSAYSTAVPRKGIVGIISVPCGPTTCCNVRMTSTGPPEKPRNLSNALCTISTSSCRTPSVTRARSRSPAVNG